MHPPSSGMNNFVRNLALWGFCQCPQMLPMCMQQVSRTTKSCIADARIAEKLQRPAAPRPAQKQTCRALRNTLGGQAGGANSGLGATERGVFTFLVIT